MEHKINKKALDKFENYEHLAGYILDNACSNCIFNDTDCKGNCYEGMLIKSLRMKHHKGLMQGIKKLYKDVHSGSTTEAITVRAWNDALDKALEVIEMHV